MLPQAVHPIKTNKAHTKLSCVVEPRNVLHRILTATDLLRLYRDLIIFGIIRISHAHVIPVNMYHYT